MVTHPSIIHCCLTSVIWLFILTAFTFGSCLCCVNVSHYKDGRAVNLFFLQSDNRIPNLNVSIRSASQQWGQKVWIVRSTKTMAKMGDHFGIHAFCLFVKQKKNLPVQLEFRKTSNGYVCYDVRVARNLLVLRPKWHGCGLHVPPSSQDATGCWFDMTP